jgi:hypothetical protein
VAAQDVTIANFQASENRLILGQQEVADGSHEIAAIPELSPPASRCHEPLTDRGPQEGGQW